VSDKVLSGSGQLTRYGTVYGSLNGTTCLAKSNVICNS